MVIGNDQPQAPLPNIENKVWKGRRSPKRVSSLFHIGTAIGAGGHQNSKIRFGRAAGHQNGFRRYSILGWY
jgi:hypothetical protein